MYIRSCNPRSSSPPPPEDLIAEVRNAHGISPSPSPPPEPLPQGNMEMGEDDDLYDIPEEVSEVQSGKSL